MPSVFLGRDLRLGRNSSLSSQGTSAEGIPQCGTRSTADAKWLLTRNIWGCQAWVPRVIQGVALGLEGVGGLEVLGTLSDLDPVLRSSQGFPAPEVRAHPREPVRAGSAQRPFPSVPELVLHYSSRPLPAVGASIWPSCTRWSHRLP